MGINGKIRVKYEDDINITHSKDTFEMRSLSIHVDGEYGRMLAQLRDVDDKGHPEMWYKVLTRVLEAGISSLYEEMPNKRDA